MDNIDDTVEEYDYDNNSEDDYNDSEDVDNGELEENDVENEHDNERDTEHDNDPDNEHDLDDEDDNDEDEDDNDEDDNEEESKTEEYEEFTTRVTFNVKEKKISKKESISKSRNIIKVKPDERVTDNRLHLPEISFILSTRAKQISMHHTNFALNNDEMLFKNAKDIAINELYNHRCPLLLWRQIEVTSDNDIIVEEWDVNTMVLPNISL